MLLDRLGFFTAAAGSVSGGRHLHLGLWFFGAAVTTVFNLDAAVVLLTPLYIRIARRHGIDPIELAIQPAMLAALASSALPVSNLTNRRRRGGPRPVCAVTRRMGGFCTNRGL